MKVLLLTNHLKNYAGSEIQILELYEYFKEQGHQVDVFANVISTPICVHFNDRDLIDDSSIIKLDNYDLIWSQHSILATLLSNYKKSCLKAIIVSVHLSPSTLLELSSLSYMTNVASIFVANSEKTKDKLIEYSVPNKKILISHNSAPKIFLRNNLILDTNKHIQKILVVSNHVPQELKDAIIILSNQGIQIDIVGDGYDVTRVNPTLIQQYDVIVSIGKTVQYGLLSSVPVYNYDYFGGAGYLTNNNFNEAKYFNFSGRGTDKKTADIIAKEIVENYGLALEFVNNFNEKNQFLLDNFMQKITNIKPSCINKKQLKNIKRHYPAEKLLTPYLIEIFKNNQRLLDVGYFYEIKHSQELTFDGKILFHWERDGGLKDNLCIFANFDLESILHDYVLYYLKELSKYFDVVFVSTSENLHLNHNAIQMLKDICCAIVVRKNEGYDFGSWRFGIELFKTRLDQYENLLLCNDSVYGPLFDIKEPIEYFKNSEYQMMGMTMSKEIQKHIQSYFVLYKKELFLSKEFDNFWSGIRHHDHKLGVVLNYDVGWSQRLLSDFSDKFKIGAYCDTVDFPKVNPTFLFWKELILNKRFPFIKVGNFKNGIVNGWKEFIAHISDYDVDLIERHMDILISRMSNEQHHKYLNNGVTQVSTQVIYFATSKNALSEKNSVRDKIYYGSNKLKFTIDDVSEAVTKLRLDPVSSRNPFLINYISIEAKNQKIIWDINNAQNYSLRFLKTLNVDDKTVFLPANNDPQILFSNLSLGSPIKIFVDIYILNEGELVELLSKTI